MKEKGSLLRGLAKRLSDKVNIPFYAAILYFVVITFRPKADFKEFL